MMYTIWGKLSEMLLVSIDGDVRTKNARTGKWITPSVQADAKGYMRVSSVWYRNRQWKSRGLHRLVAECHIPDPLYEVNHINGIKNDNSIENLEWSSTARNIAHAIETGLRERCKVAGWNRSDEALKLKIKELGAIVPRLSNREIGRRLDCNKITVGKYR